jgi:hypothetical protein
MRKVLRDKDGHRHTCDTEMAKPKAKHSVGSFGDPSGFEETLYRNRSGHWFIHGVGGPSSPYAHDEAVRLVDTNFAARAMDGDWSGPYVEGE